MQFRPATKMCVSNTQENCEGTFNIMFNPPPRRRNLVVSRDRMTLNSLSSLDEDRASSEDGLALNRGYIDCRGCSDHDVRNVLEEEREILKMLAAAGWTTVDANEILDTDYFERYELSAFDAGMSAAVVALSATGYTPISSCNGGTIGNDSHSMEVPNILFAAGPKSNSEVVWEAAVRADLGLLENGEFVEIYADQVLKFHSFAAEILRLLEAS